MAELIPEQRKRLIAAFMLRNPGADEDDMRRLARLLGVNRDLVLFYKSATIKWMERHCREELVNVKKWRGVRPAAFALT